MVWDWRQVYYTFRQAGTFLAMALSVKQQRLAASVELWHKTSEVKW